MKIFSGLLCQRVTGHRCPFASVRFRSLVVPRENTVFMMTSWNGDIFRTTLSTGHRSPVSLCPGSVPVNCGTSRKHSIHDDVMIWRYFQDYFVDGSPVTGVPLPRLGSGHWWYLAKTQYSWWRHEMEIFSALKALCEGNLSVTGGFPSRMPVTRSFYVFFDLRLDKPVRTQWRRWWFETPLRLLWRHDNVQRFVVSLVISQNKL